jgi:hypothetical protein
MSKVKVSFSVSIDGFGAAPQQSPENPMGVGGAALAEWAFATRTFQRMHGKDGGTTGIDDDFFARRFNRPARAAVSADDCGRGTRPRIRR